MRANYLNNFYAHSNNAMQEYGAFVPHVLVNNYWPQTCNNSLNTPFYGNSVWEKEWQNDRSCHTDTKDDVHSHDMSEYSGKEQKTYSTLGSVAQWASPVNLPDLSEYWTWHQYNFSSTNGYSASNSTQQLNMTALMLNKATKNQYNESANDIDKHFLFPDQEDKLKCILSSQISNKVQKDQLSSSKNEELEKVFKITKIPRAAFTMVSREILAKSVYEHAEAEEESNDELKRTNFDERKNAFGNKRDDLFYKTIGRDVRKYLQEQFQLYMGEHNIKECQKYGTFLRKFKDFFTEVIEPKLPSFSDQQKMASCVATLVSYNMFKSYCDKNLKDYSFKIHDSLHNFTKVKLVNLCRWDEFKWVFNYYAKEMEDTNFQRFRTHRTMKSNVQGYKFAYSDIYAQCN